jgi:flagellar biosynthesis anti-sigma factor FlgM
MDTHGNDNVLGSKGVDKNRRVEKGRQRPNVGSPDSSSSREGMGISSEANDLQHQPILEGVSDEKQKKVEEIRRLIQEGKYRVDLLAVSAGILEAMIVGDL